MAEPLDALVCRRQWRSARRAAAGAYCYPYMPGGVTVALNDFLCLAESVAWQTGVVRKPIVVPGSVCPS